MIFPVMVPEVVTMPPVAVETTVRRRPPVYSNILNLQHCMMQNKNLCPRVRKRLEKLIRQIEASDESQKRKTASKEEEITL
ncbi:MAG: hypothetical protein K2W95_36275 [Candidatus Obscuribacterales bacterium]|nr:hypothetical protein [Candidatus Obscuribacterales bacterium]